MKKLNGFFLYRLPQSNHAAGGSSGTPYQNGDTDRDSGRGSTLNLGGVGNDSLGRKSSVAAAALSSLHRTRSSISHNHLPKGGGNLGTLEDDMHVCVQCLRAIMNNKVRYVYI